MNQSYQAIARKYRPKQFSDIVGQEHVVRTLENAINSGKIGHAYLFVGPRGTGKTTIARIFAKCLNAEGGPCVHPNDEDEVSQSIMDGVGSCMDVVEIDGASNNSVENVRELMENCLSHPMRCRYKIFIIDEVHSLSSAASNALLKTLEEPPPYVKFILATTDSSKVLPTVVSRCQRFEFRPIPESLIVSCLKKIIQKENVSASDEALWTIAHMAAGGMRDAQSILDQMISFCNGNIEEGDVLGVYGLASRNQIESLASKMAFGDYPGVIRAVDELSDGGCDLYRALCDLQSFFRNALTRSFTDGGCDFGGYKLSSEQIIRMLDILQGSENGLKFGLSGKTIFEVAVLKAVEQSRARAINTLIKELDNLANAPAETKKKIELLLSGSLSAPDDFVCAPAPETETLTRTPPRVIGENADGKATGTLENKINPSCFDENIPEFASAVGKIPSSILKLFREQIGMKPVRYVRGLADEKKIRKLSSGKEFFDGILPEPDDVIGSYLAEEDES